MVKRLLIIVVAGLVLSRPGLIYAQSGGLTMPGAFPTLVPLSAPINNLIIPQTTPPAEPTSPPLSTGTIKPATPSGFSVSKIISPYLGHAYTFISSNLDKMKLDGITKKLLLALLQQALSLLKAYNARVDPLIGKFLTDTSARLPESIRGFTKVFIPFLTMVGKVVLGVIAGIIALKIVGFLLGKFFSSLFHRKRRRR